MAETLKTYLAQVILSCNTLEQLAQTERWIKGMIIAEPNQYQIEFILNQKKEILEKEYNECDLF